MISHFNDLFTRAEHDIKSIIFNLEENILNYTLIHAPKPATVVKEEYKEPVFLAKNAYAEFEKEKTGIMVFRERMIEEDKMEKEEESAKTEGEKHKDTLKRCNLARDQTEEPTRVILR